MTKKSPKTSPKKTPIQDLNDKLSPEARKRLEQATATIRELVKDVLPEGSSFEDYERAVLEITNEIARKELERKLQDLSDGLPPSLEIDHEAHEDWRGIGWEPAQPFRRHQPGTVQYYSLVGPLTVSRYTYRENSRNGSTYVPLELTACIMEHMTPGLAQSVAFLFSQVPARQMEAALRIAGREPPSRATLDRSAKDLGAYAVVRNHEIEPIIRAEEKLPDGTVGVALSLDRTAVPMRNADTEPFHTFPGLRRARPKGAPRSSERRGISWRMDYVGTVAFLDSSGRRLDSRQYRLPAYEEPDLLVRSMMADLRHAVGQNRHLKVVVVQDGAPELWEILRSLLRKESVVSSWDEVLDWYHVDERISACLDLADASEKERATQRDKWHAMLLEGENGSECFVRSLRRFGKRVVGSESKETFAMHTRFFAKRQSLMCYCQMRKKSLPIGSGVAEGACKSLIGTRAKRSGQHWTGRGLTSALYLRSIEQSGRWGAFWGVFSRRYSAELTAVS